MLLKKLNKNILKHGIFVVLLMVISNCNGEDSKNLPGAGAASKYLKDCKPNSKEAEIDFRNDLVRPPLSKLRALVDTDNHTMDNKFPIIIIFVDAIRADYAKELLTAFQKNVKPEDGWLSFEYGRSPATTTDYSYYSLYYGQVPFFRNWVIKEGWDLGSPFLQVLKKSGYEINAYGSPWYGCFNAKEYLYQNDYNMIYSGAVSQQLVYSIDPKGFLDNCITQNPNTPLNVSQIPKYLFEKSPGIYESKGIKFIPPPNGGPKVKLPAGTVSLFKDFKDERHDFRFQNQAYLDWYVTDVFLDKIKTNGALKPAFYFLHLWSSHAGYAWPEYGIPDQTWTTFTQADEFNKFKPYYPWNPDQKFYADIDLIPGKSVTKEQIINSYKNSINYLDYNLNRIIAELKKANVYEDSFIAIFSDHGEKLFEGDLNVTSGKISKPKNGVAHCCVPVYSNTAIPFFMKIPKSLKSKAKYAKEHFHMGRLSDVFPTAMDLVGYNNYDEFKKYYEGKSVFEDDIRCNLAVSRKGDLNPRVFNISDGKQSLLLMLNKPETASSRGVFLFRETTDGPRYSIINSFSAKDGSQTLSPILKNSNFRPCFDQLFGPNAVKNARFCGDK